MAARPCDKSCSRQKERLCTLKIQAYEVLLSPHKWILSAKTTLKKHAYSTRREPSPLTRWLRLATSLLTWQVLSSPLTFHTYLLKSKTSIANSKDLSIQNASMPLTAVDLPPCRQARRMILILSWAIQSDRRLSLELHKVKKWHWTLAAKLARDEDRQGSFITSDILNSRSRNQRRRSILLCKT